MENNTIFKKTTVLHINFSRYRYIKEYNINIIFAIFRVRSKMKDYLLVF